MSEADFQEALRRLALLLDQLEAEMNVGDPLYL
jgi:hypothetical protein